MFINQIVINNFLCYAGSDNRFEFSEGLNLVLGANGYGKSKLYDAFQWVFNDGITDNSPHATPGGLKLTGAVKGDLISEKAKANCLIGDSVETKVTLDVSEQRFTHLFVEAKRYQLVRTYKIQRTGETTWAEPGKSQFQLFQYDEFNFKPVSDAKHAEILERLLPVDVRPYVWFQGERGVNNLIDMSSEESFKKVIERLSDIEVWDKYINVTSKAFNTAQNAFNLALNTTEKGKQKISKLQSEYQQLRQQIEKLHEQHVNASQNLRAAEAKKEENFASLEFAETINRLTEVRKSAETAYKNAVKQADAFEEGLSKKLFTDNWLLLGTSSWIGEFEHKLTAYNEATSMRKVAANVTKALHEKLQIRLPDNVPEPVYVHQMLNEECCLICDRPAPKGSEAYEAIASLLKIETVQIHSQTEQTRQNLGPFIRQIYANGLTMKTSVESVDKRIQQSIIDQKALYDQVHMLEADFKAKDRDLQEQINMSGITNARDIINSMDGAFKDITKYTTLQTSLSGQIEVAEKRQREISNELAKLSEGQVPAHLLAKQTVLADLADLAKQVRKRKYEELVQQLEDTANEHYRNINSPTGAFYGSIRFAAIGKDNNSYQPTIVDEETGREVSNLNTSLVSSLKLSIIMAIISANKTSNYAGLYPLISDAPVSDFDEVKAMAFFRETARTFVQSIVIVKELLVEDDSREDRYQPNFERLRELQADIQADGKNLTVYQLDLPDGISNSFRAELEVSIQKIAC
ncbi:AAA family ATPase [Fibrella sp. USSR17]